MTPNKKTNWFTCTSAEPYDRHYYTVNEHKFDDYEQLRSWWFQQGITKGLKVNVLDYKHTKRVSPPQGF